MFVLVWSPEWHVESPGWYTVTAVAIFLVGLFYEWLITFRQGYEQRMHSKRLEEELKIQCDDDLYDVQASQPLKKLLRLTPQHQAKVVNDNFHHLVAAALHVIQLSIAYALMLVVMTYNIGLTVAVIAGAGAGYFLFARLRRNVVINEAGCH